MIANNIVTVRDRIRRAAAAAGTDADAITLVAVSKTFPAEAVREAHAAGIRDFGENYLQEALEKIAGVRAEGIQWHFVGQVQSNKTARIARHFDWVHSVDRTRTARRLSEQRPGHMPPLNVCLQVRLGGGAERGGVAPRGLQQLAEDCRPLRNLRLRGLMGVATGPDPDITRRDFQHLRKLYDDLRVRFPDMDTLSMGMSGDLEAAIACGANLVRVGSAIFGERHYSPPPDGSGT